MTCLGELDGGRFKSCIDHSKEQGLVAGEVPIQLLGTAFEQGAKLLTAPRALLRGFPSLHLLSTFAYLQALCV